MGGEAAAAAAAAAVGNSTVSASGRRGRNLHVSGVGWGARYFFFAPQGGSVPGWSRTRNNKTISAADSRAERRGRKCPAGGSAEPRCQKAGDEDTNRDMTDCSFSI